MYLVFSSSDLEGPYYKSISKKWVKNILVYIATSYAVMCIDEFLWEFLNFVLSASTTINRGRGGLVKKVRVLIA